MSNEQEADEIAQALRENFLKSIVLLKKCKRDYKFNRISASYKVDVALQNFSNELRRLAREKDDYDKALQDPEVRRKQWNSPDRFKDFP